LATWSSPKVWNKYFRVLPCAIKIKKWMVQVVVGERLMPRVNVFSLIYLGPMVVVAEMSQVGALS
jgi:hypothetical protein